MDQNANLRTFSNGLIAGYSAGMCGIIVGHPLDSIKVLLQTQNGSLSDSRTKQSKGNSGTADTAITRASKPSNTSGALPSSSTKANVSTAATPSRISTNEIIGTRSLRALYAGMAGPLMASGAIRSLNFAVYDSARRALYQYDSSNSHLHTYPSDYDDYLHYDSLNNVALASFISGASTSLFTSPMALVKTKQQIMVWGFKKAIIDTFRSNNNGAATNLIRGIANFYAGFGVHFTCDALGTAVYFTSYEWFKREISKRKDREKTVITTQNLTLPERMICAASAGMICWSVIFPFDVIRSRLYSQSINNETNLTAIELARQMIREQGVSSLYRGVGITVARAGPVAAAVLPVYDCVLSWLSRQN